MTEAELPATQISHLLARGDAFVYVEMFSMLREGVSVRNPAGEVVYANPAMLDQLGFSSLQELKTRPVDDILTEFHVEYEGGRSLGHEDLPGVKVLRGEEQRHPVTLRVVKKSTGELRWWRLTASSLRDEHDNLLGAMSVLEDLTAVRTGDLRMRALAESGRILASTLDYAQTLKNVAEVAVLLADYCSVDLISERRLLRRVAAVHRDPTRQLVAEQLGSLAPVTLAPSHPVSMVLATGRPQLFELISDDEIAAVARDPEHLDLLRILEVRSMLVVPLRVPSRIIGVMTLATDISRRRLTDDDVAIAEQLGRRAAVAVENSRLHTKLAGIAETLQRGLLPAPLPDISGWEIASLYRPAATEFRVDVGGDFYELFAHDDSWIAIVGDVTGKGVNAASVTALMRHGARVAGGTQPAPAAILARLDEALAEQQTHAMATAICMRIADSEVAISSAGHPPAVVIKLDGTLAEIPEPDPMLGAFDGIDRHEQTLHAAAGDLLVLYTDGVTDAMGDSGRFGPARLMACLSQLRGASPQDAVDRIDSELQAFASDGGGDDVAVLALRRK